MENKGPIAELASNDPRSLKHLKATFDSLVRLPALTRKNRKGQDVKVPNPIYAHDWRGNWHKFAEWSLRNGFSINSQLELLDLEVIPNKKLVVHRSKKWVEGKLVIKTTPRVVNSDDATDFIRCYKRLRWVDKRALRSRFKRTARRRPKVEPPILTAYGRDQMKKQTKGEKILAFGERKTAHAWQDDPRAKVSDKIITGRLNDLKKFDWTPEEAITTPARQKPKR